MSFPGESIVLYAIDKLIQEVKERKRLVDGVKGELRLLQDDLEIINVFLQEEGEQHEQRRKTKLVIMQQMRDVVFDAESVVDKYIYHAAMKKGEKPGPYTSLGIANTIKAIKTRIDRIDQNRGRYVGESGAQPQNAAEADDEADDYDLRNDPVGLDVININQWAEALRNPNSHRYSLITGMGGLGKSRIAWNIYASIADGEPFNCSLWVRGSRKFKARDWLRKILNGLQSQMGVAMDGNNGRNDKELEEALRKQLRVTKYLLVLDGMWDTGEWNILESNLCGLDDGSHIKGSKILITCRENVITSNTQPHYWSLKPLDQDASWDLFRRKVFREDDEQMDELTDAGTKLARNCKGLPLSIIALAELLLQARQDGKHPTEKWEKYIHRVNFELIRQKTRCFHVLAESYQHLPTRVKLCFLYLGLFRTSAEEEEKGFEISAAQLKELWSADGFIEDNDTAPRDVLDIAQDCLTKLVNGSLVQVVSKRIVGDTVKTFRIHSILRELSRYEGEREKFTELRFDDCNASTQGRGRRLSIQGDVFNLIFLDVYESSTARSLFLFNQSTGTNFHETKFWERIGRSFTYVRVLYLWKVPIQTIPDEIKNLILLKSITIWGDKKLEIKAVSDFICKLVHVESINIDGHVSKCLPEIWKMDKLKHLRVSQGMILPKPPSKGLKPAHNLSILSGVIVQENMAHSIFTNVKKLHLVYIAKRQNKQVDKTKLVVGNARQKLEEKQKKVEALQTAKKAHKNITKAHEKVTKAQKEVDKAEEKAKEAQENQEAQELKLRTSALESIEKLGALKSLKIVGFEKFDENCASKFPSTLQKITFVRSYLDLNYLISFLQKLSNLRILKVRDHYGSKTDELKSGIENKFPRLQVFIR